jgi:hypothetical protein
MIISFYPQHPLGPQPDGPQKPLEDPRILMPPKNCTIFLLPQIGHLGFSPASFWAMVANTSVLVPHLLHTYS